MGRQTRDSLTTAVSATSQDVALSPDMATQSLPRVVSTLKTIWPRNPFDPLPQDQVALGRVLEFTLRDGATGAEVPIPAPGPGDSMPVRFLIALGA